MIPVKKRLLRPFLIELVLYAVFVLVYFLGVLHFLGGWLADLFEHKRELYAAIAIVLVVVQAVGLELLTSWILRWIRQRLE
jgi:Na+-translocating ferredoxin:NAD+ oxidoreductase RnfA subunit